MPIGLGADAASKPATVAAKAIQEKDKAERRRQESVAFADVFQLQNGKVVQAPGAKFDPAQFPLLQSELGPSLGDPLLFDPLGAGKVPVDAFAQLPTLLSNPAIQTIVADFLRSTGEPARRAQRQVLVDFVRDRRERVSPSRLRAAAQARRRRQTVLAAGDSPTSSSVQLGQPTLLGT